MIFDSKEHLAQYKALGKNYETAVNFLLNTDLESLPLGKVEIDGNEVYASVVEYTTIPEESGKFETHENYSDIQYVIEGSEHMVYASRHELTPKTEYNAEKDITLYENDVKGIAMLTKKDFYCIFQPQDAHKPKVMVDSPAPIKKVIVKIKEQ